MKELRKSDFHIMI